MSSGIEIAPFDYLNTFGDALLSIVVGILWSYCCLIGVVDLGSNDWFFALGNLLAG